MIVFTNTTIDRALVSGVACYLTQVTELSIQLILNLVETLQKLVGKLHHLLLVDIVTAKLGNNSA